MDKRNVLLLEGIHPQVGKYFENIGYKVISLGDSPSEEELIKIISNVEILGIRSKTKITQKIVEVAKNLKVIGAFCIGKDQLDLKACTERGIVVFNAPFSSTTSVAELVVNYTISLSRKVIEKDTKMRLGIWEKSSAGCNEIKAMKLGIIGYGNIGQELSRIIEVFGTEVYYFDILDKTPIGKAYKCDSMEEVLRISDIISIHVDGRLENNNLISHKQFELMKDGVIFINTSRGGVVNIEALANGLRSGKVRGAGIDVYPEEPNNGDEFESVLLMCPNVILTPHIGGSTEEAQARIASYVVERITSYLINGNTIDSVNFLKLRLANIVKGKPILSYFHKNIPGKVGAVGDIIAHHGGNIIENVLTTDKDYGYMILQTENLLSNECIARLSQIEGTISLIIR